MKKINARQTWFPVTQASAGRGETPSPEACAPLPCRREAFRGFARFYLLLRGQGDFLHADDGQTFSTRFRFNSSTSTAVAKLADSTFRKIFTFSLTTFVVPPTALNGGTRLVHCWQRASASDPSPSGRLTPTQVPTGAEGPGQAGWAPAVHTVPRRPDLGT